jgi:hypothetical protein
MNNYNIKVKIIGKNKDKIFIPKMSEASMLLLEFCCENNLMLTLSEDCNKIDCIEVFFPYDALINDCVIYINSNL